ncbi:unnamed protein product [Spirodela intermedia]|uniref:Uncharacterized protein n=1 Tax=Spirodela intermedia TaxID=51605 RepID=A0A7I8L1F2_SPIIN|nr:unnamed protein product [Spirodela intermedia]
MSIMTPKILGACFEALNADNKNLRADQRRMVEDIQKVREESMDLMSQLLQNILEALEKKEHHNLQPTSSYRQAQAKSQHDVPPPHPPQEYILNDTSWSYSRTVHPKKGNTNL